MPRYDYECSKCLHAEEIYQSFSEEPLEKCPKCKKKKFRRIITNVNFAVKGETTTIGQLAEKNNKKLGKEKLEKKNDEFKARLPKKKKQWYGELPSDKRKAILGSKERAKKYIMTGE